VAPCSRAMARFGAAGIDSSIPQLVMAVSAEDTGDGVDDGDAAQEDRRAVATTSGPALMRIVFTRSEPRPSAGVM